MMETPTGGTEPIGRSTVELQRLGPPRLELTDVRTTSPTGKNLQIRMMRSA